jgi:hypothetical protein
MTTPAASEFSFVALKLCRRSNCGEPLDQVNIAVALYGPGRVGSSRIVMMRSNYLDIVASWANPEDTEFILTFLRVFTSKFVRCKDAELATQEIGAILNQTDCGLQMSRRFTVFGASVALAVAEVRANYWGGVDVDCIGSSPVEWVAC